MCFEEAETPVEQVEVAGLAQAETLGLRRGLDTHHDRHQALLAAKAQARTSKEKPAAAGTDIVVSDAQMQSLYRLVEQISVSHIGVQPVAVQDVPP